MENKQGIARLLKLDTVGVVLMLAVLRFAFPKLIRPSFFVKYTFRRQSVRFPFLNKFAFAMKPKCLIYSLYETSWLEYQFFGRYDLNLNLQVTIHLLLEFWIWILNLTEKRCQNVVRVLRIVFRELYFELKWIRNCFS